jgi:anti-anti-sigma regulatory factor
MTHDTDEVVFGEWMGVPALYIKGPFDFMHSGIDRWVDEQVAAGKSMLALDLTETHYLTAMGVACMFKIVKKLTKRGGVLQIIGATDDMVELIKLGKLDKYVSFTT